MTSVEEATLADRLGADAVGVLVGQKHASRDFVAPEIALEIFRCLSAFVSPVLVTHLENPEEILNIAKLVPCPVVQLHSELAPEKMREISRMLWPRKIIAKVSVDGEGAVEKALALGGCADAILLDSIDRSTDRVGGTGLVHDWSISARIVRQCKVPIVLAGGLNPTNVRDAIAFVKPWAVDVHSGVETPDGRKSEDLMGRFIRAVRREASEHLS